MLMAMLVGVVLVGVATARYVLASVLVLALVVVLLLLLLLPHMAVEWIINTPTTCLLDGLATLARVYRRRRRRGLAMPAREATPTMMMMMIMTMAMMMKRRGGEEEGGVAVREGVEKAPVARRKTTIQVRLSVGEEVKPAVSAAAELEKEEVREKTTMTTAMMMIKAMIMIMLGVVLVVAAAFWAWTAALRLCIGEPMVQTQIHCP